MKRTLIIIAVVLALGTAAFFFLRSRSGSEQKYQTATVTQGDLKATVTSTGTITAVGTVQVGTQVSGTVEEVYVDFNSHVQRGQLLARLDTRVLQAAVDDANANLARVKAQYEAALDQYNRNKPLYDKKYISGIEFTQYRSGLEAAKASVTSAQVALERAKTNYGYAEIRSPTDGTVIARAVEPGQTVAASLSTPTLFTIANDLSQMQIEASVDESDIGQIEEGQHATFTIQSQPDRTFEGTVKQIRLQSTVVQNVVNYTVIVTATNNENLLLPGMTATVNFEVKSVKNVLTVPNAALRFQPPADALEGMGATGRDTAARRARTPRDSSARRSSGADSTSQPRDTTAGGSQTSRAQSRGRIWTTDETGKLRMISVRVGLSDGQRTEISGPDVREGMTVITGIAQPQTTTGASRTGTGLPFGGTSSGGRQGAGGRQGGGGRGGF